MMYTCESRHKRCMSHDERTHVTHIKESSTMSLDEHSRETDTYAEGLLHMSKMTHAHV